MPVVRYVRVRSNCAASVALVASIWTYAWIGWWALLPTGIACVRLAINPRVFSPRGLFNWFLDRMALLHDDEVAARAIPPR